MKYFDKKNKFDVGCNLLHQSLTDKRKRNGFTIAEMMVCLAIISVIATILIPAIMHSKPNKNKVLFRKAYMLTERIVSELINDEDAYKLKNEEDKHCDGFEEVSAATVYDTTASGDVKFCKLFAGKLNIIGEEPNCTANQVAFTTSDGIQWTMPITSFIPDIKYDIKVDVNGEKAPNCTYSAANCPDPDQFIIKIKRDGGVSVDDDLSEEYLRTLDTVKR